MSDMHNRSHYKKQTSALANYSIVSVITKLDCSQYEGGLACTCSSLTSPYPTSPSSTLYNVVGCMRVACLCAWTCFVFSSTIPGLIVHLFCVSSALHYLSNEATCCGKGSGVCAVECCHHHFVWSVGYCDEAPWASHLGLGRVKVWCCSGCGASRASINRWNRVCKVLGFTFLWSVASSLGWSTLSWQTWMTWGRGTRTRCTAGVGQANSSGQGELYRHVSQLEKFCVRQSVESLGLLPRPVSVTSRKSRLILYHLTIPLPHPTPPPTSPAACTTECVRVGCF